MAKAPDVIIIAPGLLEAATIRGGGIEEIDYLVAKHLSNRYRVVMIGPFHGKFMSRVNVSDTLAIENTQLPALRRYPPHTQDVPANTMIRAPIQSILVAFKLARIRTKKRQLVVVHSGFPGLVAALAAKVTRRNILYSEGNTYPWTNPYLTAADALFTQRVAFLLNRTVAHVTGNLADTVRAQSTSIKQGMERAGLDPGKIVVIPAGVDIERFRPNDNLQPTGTRLKIGFVGRLTNEKGAPILVETIRKCQHLLPELEFHIFGDGPFRRALEPLPNVKYIGWTSRHQLVQMISEIHVLLFFQKELGLAELQGMASGKVILASDAGEIRQTLEHGVNCLLCKPIPDAYVEALKTLKEDPSQMRILSRNAREAAVIRFRWETVLDMWTSICDPFLSSGDVSDESAAAR